MTDFGIFSLTSQRMEWLSVRQAAIASNIANADTPAYRARDVAPFEAYLNGSQLGVARTDPRHIDMSGGNQFSVEATNHPSSEVKHSGNTVSLEHELVRAGEVRGAHSLTVAVVRSFHQLILSAVRG